MARSPLLLGDRHNFGRQVSLQGGRIHKPRPVLWEWLVLGHDGPLRRKLAQLGAREGLGDAFGFLPSLRYTRAPGGLDGAVEPIALSPLGRLSRSERPELAAIVGRSLALWSFLGVADLHFENLALGRDDAGRIVLGPLDLEMILDELSLPTQTKLLPEPDDDPEHAALVQHACGLRRVLPHLGKPVDAPELLTMAASYRQTIQLLERHGRELAAVLARLPWLRSTPIRVTLRSTADYVQAQSSPPWPPLLDAEAEQLARGDVPYFFRFYGRPGIHYYVEPTRRRLGRLPSRGDVPRLSPLLSLARGLSAPSRRTLRDEGLLLVLGAFDHPGLGGTHGAHGLGVRFGARSLIVTLPDGSTLRADRDLSAHVGSVYLPCRCGEVRSVLVPAKTRCLAR